MTAAPRRGSFPLTHSRMLITAHLSDSAALVRSSRCPSTFLPPSPSRQCRFPPRTLAAGCGYEQAPYSASGSAASMRASVADGLVVAAAVRSVAVPSMHTWTPVDTGLRVEVHVGSGVHGAAVLIVPVGVCVLPGQPKRARSRLAFGLRVDHRHGAAAVTRGAALQNHRYLGYDLDGLDVGDASSHLLDREHVAGGVLHREGLEAALHRRDDHARVGIRCSGSACPVDGVHYDAVELDVDRGASR
eukprot:scaffold54611_cov65-Phaeocystis_antarctica.AAC.2